MHSFDELTDSGKRTACLEYAGIRASRWNDDGRNKAFAELRALGAVFNELGQKT